MDLPPRKFSYAGLRCWRALRKEGCAGKQNGDWRSVITVVISDLGAAAPIDCYHRQLYLRKTPPRRSIGLSTAPVAWRLSDRRQTFGYHHSPAAITAVIRFSRLLHLPSVLRGTLLPHLFGNPLQAVSNGLLIAVAAGHGLIIAHILCCRNLAYPARRLR